MLFLIVNLLQLRRFKYVYFLFKCFAILGLDFFFCIRLSFEALKSQDSDTSSHCIVFWPLLNYNGQLRPRSFCLSTSRCVCQQPHVGAGSALRHPHRSSVMVIVTPRLALQNQGQHPNCLDLQLNHWSSEVLTLGLIRFYKLLFCETKFLVEKSNGNLPFLQYESLSLISCLCSSLPIPFYIFPEMGEK